MNSKTISFRFIFVTTAIIIAAISRIFPHIPNFTPLAAMALFGGVYMDNKLMAFIVPLLAMLLSDLFIGFHNTIIYVYVAFILTTLIGLSIRNNVKPANIAVASLASSALFFLITNFGVWAANGMANGITGMFYTYELGIPFFRWTLLGDLFYNGILFGAFYLAQLRFPILAKVKI